MSLLILAGKMTEVFGSSMYTKLMNVAGKYLQQTEAEYAAHAARYEELVKYDGFNLSRSHRSDMKDQFYYQLRGCRSNKRVYVGDESSTVVESIRECRYLKQFVSDALFDIKLLKHMISSLRPLDRDSVERRLPPIYRGSQLNAASQDDKRGIEWKSRKEAIKARFPVKNPEDLNLQALDGTWVRSKSELTIANMLIFFNIPFVYEFPYVIGGITYYLDFTILSTIDYETEIIIEHQGMMDLDRYKGKYLNTLTACLKNGIVPNVDIYFTFDDYHGRVIDTGQILNIINSRLILTSAEPADQASSGAAKRAGR